MDACAKCRTAIDAAQSYFSDAGLALCGTCFHREQIALNEVRLNQDAAEESAFKLGMIGLAAARPDKKGKKTSDPGIGGGLFLMIASVGFFGVGLAVDRIYFYPPILFVIGVAILVRGIRKKRLKAAQAAPASIQPPAAR